MPIIDETSEFVPTTAQVVEVEVQKPQNEKNHGNGNSQKESTVDSGCEVNDCEKHLKDEKAPNLKDCE